MKKLVVIAVLASVAGMASAAEFGLRAGRHLGVDVNSAGVTASQKYGAVGAEVAYDRTLDFANPVTRWSGVGSYNLVKVAGVTVAAKAGAGYLDNARGYDGWVALAGVGATVPVTKNMSLVADYAYQKAQTRIAGASGNTVTAGVKFAL